MKNVFLIFFFFCSVHLFAQEFNCNVQVLSPQLQQTDKRIFETMQNSLRDFINNRKWTDDNYLNQERIECSIIININERQGSDQFKGTLQIQARRPVYKTSYNTATFNFNDENLNFRYIEDQVLEYGENNPNNSALTNIIAFYCYVMLGIDYDTFSLNGGTPYFQRAQTIVNQSQNASEPGWKSFESIKNRYWIIENFLSPVFASIREVLYRYHRKGLDVMATDVSGGRREILDAMELWRKVASERPNSLLAQIFFNAKADELVNIFSGGEPDEKTKAANLLSEIDPSNTSKYQKITK